MKKRSLLLACFSLLPLSAFAQQALPDAPSALRAALPVSFVEPQPYDAQQNSQSAQSPDKTQQGKQQPDKPPQQGSPPDPFKAEDNQRILGVVSTRNIVLNGHADPLTTGQKYTLWLHSAIDPFGFVVTGFVAGIEQAHDSYPGYGQGAAGYGKRFGAAYADSVDSHLWGKAILPTVLHQDPRYFRLGRGSFKHRFGYALAAVVRCKGDNGRWQFAYSNIGGNFIGGAIANVYYPPADRGIGLLLNRGLIVTAEGAFGLIASEFYPDVLAHFKKKKAPPQP